MVKRTESSATVVSSEETVSVPVDESSTTVPSSVPVVEGVSVAVAGVMAPYEEGPGSSTAEEYAASLKSRGPAFLAYVRMEGGPMRRSNDDWKQVLAEHMSRPVK